MSQVNKHNVDHCVPWTCFLATAIFDCLLLQSHNMSLSQVLSLRLGLGVRLLVSLVPRSLSENFSERGLGMRLVTGVGWIRG